MRRGNPAYSVARTLCGKTMLYGEPRHESRPPAAAGAGRGRKSARLVGDVERALDRSPTPAPLASESILFCRGARWVWSTAFSAAR
jgi:hypothetical protein